MTRQAIRIAVVCGVIVVGGAAVAFYNVNQAHSLMHAAEAGRIDQVLAALEKAPNDAGLWELLGDAHAKRSDYTQAVHAYQRSIQLNPGDETTWWMMGIAEVCRQDADGMAAAEVGLRQLNAKSADEFARMAPKGCCAFGGCAK